jgi:signal transduction histidine kinase
MSRTTERARLSSPQLMVLLLVLVIASTALISFVTGMPARWAVAWLIARLAVAAAAGGFLLRAMRRTQELSRQETQQTQALLERLSIATQAAGVYCWELDWGTYVITWDQARLPAAEQAAASRRHFGFELGSDLFKYVHPDDQHIGGKTISEALERGEDHASFRYRIVLPNGQVRHVQAYARTYINAAGKPQRSVGVSWDVTAEVEATERAARDAAMQRQLLEQLSVAMNESHTRQAELEALSIRFGVATRAAKAGVWEWLEQTDAVWWNDMMYSIYGLSPDTFQPDMSTLIGMIHSDDLALAQAAWENALHNTGQAHVQFRIARRDGTLAHVEQIAAMVVDPETSHRRLVGITLDVGHRVAAEERERQLQKKLREASHQSGMAEVATGVLHNVGNVLNSLGVASSTAQSRLKASQFDRVQKVAQMLEEQRYNLGQFFADDPRGRKLPEYLGALGSQLQRDAADMHAEFETLNGHLQYLREIVQAQQSFARVGEAEETVDVRELIDTALALQGRELKGVEIGREFGHIPEIRTDRYKLLQIIVNFVGNARDALAASEIGTRRITLRADVVNGQLEVAVEDSGIGIPPQLLQRIWEFGFTTKAHGHGFGLHSAAVAAQALGGSVTARSAGPGQGACFMVRIPLKAGKARSDAA